MTVEREGDPVDPTTQELRRDVGQRETEEREAAASDDTEAGTSQHDARAMKAAYLKAKLEERAEAERRKAAEDEDD
jgi:hypothetical protein